MNPPLLQICRSLDPAGGGYYRAARALAKELRKLDIPVINRTLFPLDGDGAGEDLGQIRHSPLLARMANVIPGKYGKLLFEIPVFTIMATISAVRARNSVVLVHGESFTGDIYRAPSCHRAAIGAKRKLGEWKWFFYPLHHFWLLREWFVYGFGKRPYLVAVSKASAEEHQRCYAIPDDRVFFISNGVDGELFRPAPDRKGLRKELGLPEESFLFLFVGNDFINKGLHQAIEGLARTDPADDARLVVVGRDLREPYIELARKLGVEDRVIFVGARGDVERYYAAVDVFVLLSNYEAFGNVVMESLSCGTPVVITVVGGLVDYVKHEENGLFTERRGESVGAAFNRLMKDDKLLAQLSKRARPSTETYQWGSIAKEYRELYRKAAAEKGL